MSIRRHIPSFIGALLSQVVSAGVLAGGTNWYVDDNAPGDPGPGNPLVSDPLEDGSPGRPFDAIQEAIDASGAGDVILVVDGTYTGVGNRSLNYFGRSIEVRSISGNPASCIIDCQSAGLAFQFLSGEPAAARLTGLKVVGGAGFLGGGGAIAIDNNSSPTVTNCIFESNSASVLGGAVEIVGSSPHFVNCTFQFNSSGSEGGAVHANSSDSRFTNCVFLYNVSTNYGGAINLSNGSTVVIDGCLFSANQSTNAGGGAIRSDFSSPQILNSSFVSNFTIASGASGGAGGAIRNSLSSPVIRDCTFSVNAAHGINAHGGAIYNTDSSPLIEDCHFELGFSEAGGAVRSANSGTTTVRRSSFASNEAELQGGGLYVTGSSTLVVDDSQFEENISNDGGAIRMEGTGTFTITRSRFIANDAGSVGGAMTNAGSAGEIVNCLFVGNTSLNGIAGALYSASSSAAAVRHSTFVANSALNGFGGAIHSDGPSPLLVDHTIVWVNLPDGVSAPNSTMITLRFSVADWFLGPGCFNANPQLVDPANGDLRLRPTSPCIDRGNNTIVPVAVTTDFEGNPRIVDGDGDAVAITDMGAYEFDPAAYIAVENLTQSTTHGSIVAALAAANQNDSLLASVGAFIAAGDVDFNGKGVTLASSGPVAQATSDVYTMADGATLASAPGTDVTPNGLLRIEAGDQAEVQGQSLLLGATGAIDVFANAGLTVTTTAPSTLSGATTLLASGTLSFNQDAANEGSMTMLNGATLDVGGTWTNRAQLNMSSAYLLADTFHNDTGGSVVGYGEWFTPVLNDAAITTIGDTTVVGDYTNNGTTTVQIGTLTIIGSLTNNGTIVGDVQTTMARSAGGGGLTMPGDGMSVSGSYIAGAGAALLMPTDVWRLSVGGDFDIAINGATRYDMADSELRLNGGGMQDVERMSRDIGPDPAGYDRSFTGHFPLGTLHVRPLTTANLVDAHDNDRQGQAACEALYVTALIVEAGATLNTNGCPVYYDTLQLDGVVDNPRNLTFVKATLCPADTNGDDVVNVTDLLDLLASWGPCAVPCPSDVNSDGVVNVTDLLALLAAWGAC